MTNTKLFEDVVRESGLKKGFLAEKCGLSRAGFRNCVVGKAEFNARHIIILCELLNISPEMKERIFFDKDGA